MVEDKLCEPVKFCILRNVITEGFKNSKQLSDLTDVQTEKLMNALNNRRMNSGATLFKKGEPTNKWLVLLLEGSLKT